MERIGVLEPGAAVESKSAGPTPLRKIEATLAALPEDLPPDDLPPAAKALGQRLSPWHSRPRL